MFLKKCTYKNGRTYLSIVNGYKVNGKAKHEVIKKLGYLDELEKEYSNPIEHFNNLAKQMNKEFDDNPFVENLRNKKLIKGETNTKNIGYAFIKKIYSDLNLTNYLKSQQSSLKVDYDLNKIFSLLIYSRIMYPGSKKDAYDNKDRFFEQFDFSLKDLYRSLDYFNQYKEEIQTTIWNATKNLYNRDTTNSYYDCTNYYFEIDYNDTDLLDEEGNILEKGYRKRGPEKNHRPDPIVEMGLLMDSTGIPLAYDLFPGNESEKTSLHPILTRTKAKFGIERTIVVADRGLNTSDNIFFLAGKNGDDHIHHDGYVYGQSVRGADKEFKEWCLNQDGYIDEKILDENGKEKSFRAMIFNDDGSLNHYESKPIIFRHKSRIFAKEIKIKKENERKVKTTVYQKQMVYFSQKYADKQRRERNMMIDRANDLIKHPQKYTRITSKGSAAYVNNIQFDKKTGEVLDGLELSLNEEKIREEEKYDGYYSIVTSELNMTDQKIRDVYRGLTKIEESFKITKSNFEARPVYVWTKEHIEAHFLTCFVSLVIIRLLEKKLDNKYSIDKIINSLKKCQCIMLTENRYLYDYYDDIIEELSSKYNIILANSIITKKKKKKILDL